MVEQLSSQSVPDYLAKLNPEQMEAVVHEGSPLLILAGAGSGKTRVITTKIAYLIREKNVDPYSILAVTFTKKAAKEMAERAVALEPRSEYAQLRTFHSFGAWFLRRYADAAGLVQSFTVYDDDDMVTLLTKAVSGLTRSQASAAAHKIALAKDYCLGPDDDLSTIDATGEIAELYRAYEKRLRSTGNTDFGDLIMMPVKVMEADAAIRAQMISRFRVIMVDEYQDSNVAQFKMLQMLSGADIGSETYVCVVGDDDQSIYKFRGAEVQNILTFKDHFPGTKIIRLERNYRSTAKILAAADAVVRNNDGRLGKTLRAERGEGKTPVLAFLPTQDEEAAFCAKLIMKAHTGTDKQPPVPYHDWAILYRTNAQSLGFETEFLHRQIPYVVVGSLKFYEREEIKDMLAVLALAANPHDEIAFRRIINKPAHGIGEKTQDSIVEKAKAAAGTEEIPAAGAGLVETAKQCADTLSKKAAAGVREFCAVMEGLTSSYDEDEKLSAFVKKAAEQTGLLDYHRSQDEISGTQREANIQELANSAAPYACTLDGLLEFLDSIELDRSLSEESENGATDSVTLITLHNTKGLEFPRVIITGLEQGIFPRADKTGSDLEEERRLFYVGITRAKDELYITSCGERRMYGRTERMQPSVFLSEAGRAFRVLGRKDDSPAAPFGRQIVMNEAAAGPFAELAAKWKKGTMVYHDDWGTGQVVATETGGEEFVIIVQFESGAQKKFLPQYQARSLMIVKD